MSPSPYQIAQWLEATLNDPASKGGDLYALGAAHFGMSRADFKSRAYFAMYSDTANPFGFTMDRQQETKH